MGERPDYDVLIVGGGPVGAAAALALRGSGLALGLLEARPAQSARADTRPIALSHGGRLILERLGVWDRLAPATPIRRIHVSQRGGFGRVELDAAEARLPALGYVLDYARLANVLAGALDEEGHCRRIRATVTGFETEADRARVRFDGGQGPAEAAGALLAVADGGALAVAPVRTRDYGQAAVTARVTCSAPRPEVAFERFTPAGPLALLPSGAGYALVWSTTPAEARRLCDLPEAQFLEQLQHDFGNRVGTFGSVAGRAAFPLALRVAARAARPRTVVLGNAAQMLHPVAAQGLNLGLRDAWELGSVIRNCDRAEIGGPEQIRAFHARRRIDRVGGVWFTDALVRLFSNDIKPLKLARGLGLAVLAAAPPAKDFFIRRMTFGTRG